MTSVSSQHAPRMRFLATLFAAAFALPLLAASASAVLAHGYKLGDLAIEHPWTPATPTGAKVAAGYLTIENKGDTPDRLIAVSAEIAGESQIHEMSMSADGVMTMRPLAGGAEIPAGGKLELKPGGKHIMFMKLVHTAVEGEMIEATLTFEHAGTLKVEFAVEAQGADHHDHDAMQ